MTESFTNLITAICILAILLVIFPLVIDEFKYPHDWGDRELNFCLKAHIEKNKNFALMDCKECDAYRRGRCVGVVGESE